MRLVRLLVPLVRSRPRAAFSIALLSVPNFFAVAAFGLASPGGTSAPVIPRIAVPCAESGPGSPQCQTPTGPTLGLPKGTTQCPFSSDGAACATTQVAAGKPSPGKASTPDGMVPCPPTDMTRPGGLAGCVDVGAPTGASVAAPETPQPSHSPATDASLPRSSLRIAGATVELVADRSFAPDGQEVTFTATATASVSGAGKAIEIFDMTTRTDVGTCLNGNQCVVNYFTDGGTHSFMAFITNQTAVPPSDAVAASSSVSVDWEGLWLISDDKTVGPGQTATIKAVTSAPKREGYVLQLFDAQSNERIAYCGQGNSCAITLTNPATAVEWIHGIYGPPATTLPGSGLAAESSGNLPVTWLGASMSWGAAVTSGANFHLTASANADLTGTPWSIAIFDESGHLVGKPCNKSSSCSADISLSGNIPTYFAAIGIVPQTGKPLTQVLQPNNAPVVLVNVQAISTRIRPSRLLWGVDSCKSITGLYGYIAGGLGAPDFWGRYLTNTVCPGIGGAEVTVARDAHFGILPIYNDYNCSNVVGYDTGKGYAIAAAAAAERLGIPHGRGIAIDIEPPGDACPGAANIDSGFIHGWHDGMTDLHYVPIYYGNGTASSEFGAQWCIAVNAMPYIAQHSFVWSFEPSLLDGFNKGNAPGFGPNLPNCAGNTAAWQYQIGSNSVIPDVDQDEATTDLPLWYP